MASEEHLIHGSGELSSGRARRFVAAAAMSLGAVTFGGMACGGAGNAGREAAAPGPAPARTSASTGTSASAPAASDKAPEAPAKQPEREATATPVHDAPAPAAPPPIPPRTVVLHIGDSFLLSGFAQALKPRFVGVGAKYEVRSEQSSFTTTWSAKLGPIVTATQPDLVLITLGANEVANVDPPAHAPAVRNIVRQIGGRPCVWVSPPLWAKETGILDVLREHSAPCRFFDSDVLVTAPIPRRSDKIHPTTEGGAVWAEAFWTWLHAERAAEGAPTASDEAELLPLPSGKRPQPPKRSPWALRPAPADEHVPKRAQPASSAAPRTR